LPFITGIDQVPTNR